MPDRLRQGGQAKLSLNAIWPGSVYKLLRRALTVHKTLGYVRPIVKNLACMRPTKTAPLIPIHRETDLDSLLNTLA